MTVTTDKARIGCYMDSDIKEDLERLAKLERRSISNLLEILALEAITEAKKAGRL